VKRTANLCDVDQSLGSRVQLTSDICSPLLKLTAFARYSRDSSFDVLCENGLFVLVMAAGSVTGTIAGGLMLGVVPDLVWFRCWCCF
jgi:hypothetical protein